MTTYTYPVFFRNLANPLKMQIIYKLKEKKSSVNEIAHDLDLEQSKVSHALAMMKKCRIVECKQSGKQRIYSLNKETIMPMLELIDKHEKKFCERCHAKHKK